MKRNYKTQDKDRKKNDEIDTVNYRFLKFIAFLHDANTAILYIKYTVHDICAVV
jgi:hypothetical protein